MCHSKIIYKDHLSAILNLSSGAQLSTKKSSFVWILEKMMKKMSSEAENWHMDNRENLKLE